MNKTPEQKQKLYRRVIAFLNREQIDFLDKIGKDALFSKGIKLSRSKIIATLVDLLTELNIDGEGFSTLEELKKSVKDKIFPKEPIGPTTREILMGKDKEAK